MKKSSLVGLAVAILSFGMATTANATLISDNFNDGNMDGWTPKIGSWSVGAGNDLSNSGSVYGVVWKDDSFGVYQKIQVDAYFDFSGSQDDKIAHLRLRTGEHAGATQPFWDTGYLADFQQNRIRIQNTYLGGNPEIASFDFTNSPFLSNGWYELAFGVDGTGANTHFNAWVNGVQYIDQTYNNTIAALDSGYVGLGRKIHYDNVQGYSSLTPIPEPSTILLFGAGFAGLLGLNFRRKNDK